MNKRTGIISLIAGGLIGAVIALLYAPRSGEETRQLIADNSMEIKDKALRSIQEVQESALLTIEQSAANLDSLIRETRARNSTLNSDRQITLEEQELEEQPS